MNEIFKNAWNGLAAMILGTAGVVGAQVLKDLQDAGVIGTEGAVLLKCVGALFLFVLLIVWQRNYELLGAGREPPGSDARRRYD